jgi:hypothetical protein
MTWVLRGPSYGRPRGEPLGWLLYCGGLRSGCVFVSICTCPVVRRANVRRIVIRLRKLLLAVVVCAPKNRTSPVCEEALGLTLDCELGLFALDVEHDDFANTRGDQCVLVYWEFGKGRKELFLDVVCGKTTVAEWFQEEADRLEEVYFGVDDGVLETVLVQKGDNFREKLELVARRLVALAAFVVGFGSGGHAAAHLFDFLVGHLLEVDAILLATARVARTLDEGVDLAVERALPSYHVC